MQFFTKELLNESAIFTKYKDILCICPDFNANTASGLLIQPLLNTVQASNCLAQSELPKLSIAVCNDFSGFSKGSNSSAIG